MKKILKTFSFIILCIVLASCGEAAKSPNTLGTKIVADFKNEIKKSDSLSDIADTISKKDYIEFKPVVTEAKPGTLTGFTKDITGFTQGYCIMPMINTIPFITYIFKTDKMEDLKKTVEENADTAWNICTVAGEKIVDSVDDYVIIVMAPGEKNE